MNNTLDSAFLYGEAQIISTAVVLGMSLVLGTISLIGLSQGGREQRDYQALGRASIMGITEEQRTPGGLEDQRQMGSSSACSINSDIHNGSPLQSIPYMIASTQSEHTHTTGHTEVLCDGLQQSSSEQPLNLPDLCLPIHDERQTVRHVLLCLLLIVSLLANLSSCLWWLFSKDPGRLYLELQFFCVAANFGQGFISFGVFGLDRHLIILPFKKRLLSLWHGREEEEESTPSVIPGEVRLTCTQFVHYHKDQCHQDIVHTRRCGRGRGGGGAGAAAGGDGDEESEYYGVGGHGQIQGSYPEQNQAHSAEQEKGTNRNNHQQIIQEPWIPPVSPSRDLASPQRADNRLYPYPRDQPNVPDFHPQSGQGDPFRGSDLVNWLVRRGPCSDRTEAWVYGGRLLWGEVLHHFAHGHGFKDPTLLYRFAQGSRPRMGKEDGSAPLSGGCCLCSRIRKGGRKGVGVTGLRFAVWWRARETSQLKADGVTLSDANCSGSHFVTGLSSIGSFD